MKNHTIAITIRSFLSINCVENLIIQNYNLSYLNKLGRRLTSEEIIIHCKTAEAIIAGTEHFSRETLFQLPSLKVISRVGVGTDSIDMETAREKGITILTTPISPIPAVAEHTISLLLAICKKIPDYLLSQKRAVSNIYLGNQEINREKKFIEEKKSDFSGEDNSPRISPGYLIKGKVIGIIGLGKVGFEVARILSCFGGKILYYDPYIGKNPDIKWEYSPSLPHLLQKADIISIHTTPLADDKPLLDGPMFTHIKKGTILINTARGSLIDEFSLIKALEDNTVIGAGLDVLPTDPYFGPLLDNPGVIITPHVASNTYESRKQMELEAIQNIIQYFRDLA